AHVPLMHGEERLNASTTAGIAFEQIRFDELLCCTRQKFYRQQPVSRPRSTKSIIERRQRWIKRYSRLKICSSATCRPNITISVHRRAACLQLQASAGRGCRDRQN